MPSNAFMDWLAETFCEDDWLDLEFVCESIMFLLCGFNPAQTNDTLMGTIVHHTPAGTSTFTVLQYAQEVTSGMENLLSCLIFTCISP